jgi:dTDP-4-dehydrorhamnose reductase
MKKVLIVGYNGYVGHLVYRYFQSKYEVYGMSSKTNAGSHLFQCDFTNMDNLRETAKRINPDLIIHAAGNKNINYCEQNPKRAYQVNGESVKNLIACFNNDPIIIYISTDYVFDGKRGNYLETDLPDPQTVYGKSKFYGEQIGLKLSERFIILRLAALFDNYATFPKFLRENLTKNQPVECYSNAIYSPTYYKDFLDMLEQIIEREELKYRCFHSCGEPTTRYHFARIYARIFGYPEKLIQEAITSVEQTHLYPNLALNNDFSRKYLNSNFNSLETAFSELRSTSNHETFSIL